MTGDEVARHGALRIGLMCSAHAASVPVHGCRRSRADPGSRAEVPGQLRRDLVPAGMRLRIAVQQQQRRARAADPREDLGAVGPDAARRKAREEISLASSASSPIQSLEPGTADLSYPVLVPSPTCIGEQERQHAIEQRLRVLLGDEVAAVDRVATRHRGTAAARARADSTKSASGPSVAHRISVGHSICGRPRNRSCRGPDRCGRRPDSPRRSHASGRGRGKAGGSLPARADRAVRASALWCRA